MRRFTARGQGTIMIPAAKSQPTTRAIETDQGLKQQIQIQGIQPLPAIRWHDRFPNPVSADLQRVSRLIRDEAHGPVRAIDDRQKHQTSGTNGLVDEKGGIDFVVKGKVQPDRARLVKKGGAQDATRDAGREIANPLLGQGVTFGAQPLTQRGLGRFNARSYRGTPAREQHGWG